MAFTLEKKNSPWLLATTMLLNLTESKSPYESQEAISSWHIYQQLFISHHEYATAESALFKKHQLTEDTARDWKSMTATCFSGSSMNSSVLDTSTKCCRTYLCADLSRSLQECVSANPRIPRQLEGSSWLRRNLQQASRTPLSCSRLAAGSSV